jgi:hypothetical protein
MLWETKPEHERKIMIHNVIAINKTYNMYDTSIDCTREEWSAGDGLIAKRNVVF